MLVKKSQFRVTWVGCWAYRTDSASAHWPPEGKQQLAECVKNWLVWKTVSLKPQFLGSTKVPDIHLSMKTLKEAQTSLEVRLEEGRVKWKLLSMHRCLILSSWLLLFFSWPPGSLQEWRHERRRGAGTERYWGDRKSVPREGFFFPNSLPILDHFTEYRTYMKYRHCLPDKVCCQRTRYAFRGRPLCGIFIE